MSHAGAPRVLVLTASVGAGHDTPARALEAGLRARRPDARVEIIDALDLMGPLVQGAAEDTLRRTVGSDRLHWVFDLQHLLFARSPLRAAGQAALQRTAGPRLLDAVTRRRPDVIVSTYPVSTEVLGRLRRAGRLAIPAAGAVTDLASLHYWACRGVDLHLVTHPESLPEVERIAGPGAARAACGLYDDRFLDPPGRDEARLALGLDPDGAVVAVSGGGWGVGDVAGAVGVALERPATTVLALCGRNDSLRTRLEATTRRPEVRVLPFVDDMPTVLAASDALVHATAGLTVLEALLAGCRPISYGWGIGHVRANNRAYRRLGLARVAAGRAELRSALADALAEPRQPLAPGFARLPHAADLVLDLVERRR